MPWKMVKNGSQWCIRKKLDDGTLGELVKGSCHKSRTMTLRMLRALYMHASELVDDVSRITEAEGSDLVNEITEAFKAKFGEGYIIRDIWDEYIIVGETESDDLYKVMMDISTPDFAFVGREEWTPVFVEYVTEMNSRVYDAMAVWEFKGKFPNVPISPKVNLDELTAGDKEPFFVTLPIAQVNTVSNNRRFYGEDVVNAFERIVNEELPGALMGHLPPDEANHAFPTEAAYWVGAKRLGEFLWGKAYVPPGEARERIRRYKALGKKLATSIDATLKGTWDSTLGAMRMLAEDAKLHSIDFAPVERAGIPSLGIVPIVTREMCADCDAKGDDAKMDKVVTELRSLLGEDADLVAKVKELVEYRLTAEREAINRRIHELVANKENGVAVEALRPLVIQLVETRDPKTVEEVDAAFAEIMASPEVKAALESYVTTTMGIVSTPAIPTYFSVPKQEKASEKYVGKYFTIPSTED